MSSLQSLPLAAYSQVTNQLRPPSSFYWGNKEKLPGLLVVKLRLLCGSAGTNGISPDGCSLVGARNPTSLSTDELSRPIVDGPKESSRSQPNGMAAIREIFLSFFNLPAWKPPSRLRKMGSQAAGWQASPAESWRESGHEYEDPEEGLGQSNAALPVSQVDIRATRHRAAWINPQRSAEEPLQLLDSSTPAPQREQDKVHPITSLGYLPVPPGDSLPETLLLGDNIATEGSSLPCSEEADKHVSLALSEQHVMLPEKPPPAILTQAKVPTSSPVPVDSSASHQPLRPRSPPGEGTVPASGKTPPQNSFSSETLMLPADVEKENAHFYVADMIISAVETMKYNLLNQQQGETWEGMEMSGSLGSDQADFDRGFYVPGKQKSSSATSSDSGYEGCSVLQVNPAAEIPIHPNRLKELCECDSDDFVIVELEDFDKITETCRCLHDFNKRSTDEPGFNSAELLAKELYRTFCRCFKLAEVDFHQAGSLQADRSIAVNEDNLQKDFESSLDVVEEIKFKSRIRGSKEWAPPKFEIIFNVHPPLKRDFVVSAQNFSCAGCGTPVERKYMKRLRYCDYLGKYFCDCCHSYAESYIPARILMKWDFHKYHVSNFSRHLLNSIWHRPLFNLSFISQNLYSKAKELDRVREIQEKLVQIKKLLQTCRFAERILKDFEQVPGHLTNELHLFSLDDLVKIKKGHLAPVLRGLLNASLVHVDSCELCQGNGFICEFCQSTVVIFPFQTTICRRCPACKTCFHKQCFRSADCPKCLRIQARKKLWQSLPSLTT
ncbi:protein associated with UVRAG as autophagy enhancer [Gracilinanus agilis]|uniref:protein associated with UVRAG as autophagy enhancer n=1 Tax=Gracilinanus agilis TaxID=191870 RepID=UPI001CFDC315|nr:protein associated with UVRAG as autophagy enhancer [Gracilinanus agilis]